jgi:hypothetical protein
MGGSGSGWQGSRKIQVEECLILSAGRLQTSGILRPNLRGTGRINWRDESGDDIGGGTWEIDVTTKETEGRISILQPGHPWPLHSADVTSTVLPWGARRWWLICPLRGRWGGGCLKRVGKLYLPPGGDTFGCRHCYKLSYWARQSSSRFDRLDRCALRLLRECGR